MLLLINFGNRQAVRHLLCQPLEEVAIALDDAAEGLHDVRADEVLRGDNVLKIVPQCLLEYVSLRLTVLPGDGGKLIPKPGVDFWSNLFGFGSWHERLHCYYKVLSGLVKLNLDLSGNLWGEHARVER